MIIMEISTTKQEVMKMSINEKLNKIKEHNDQYTIYIDNDDVSAVPDEGADLEVIYLGNTGGDVLTELLESMGFHVGEV